MSSTSLILLTNPTTLVKSLMTFCRCRAITKKQCLTKVRFLLTFRIMWQAALSSFDLLLDFFYPFDYYREILSITRMDLFGNTSMSKYQLQLASRGLPALVAGPLRHSLPPVDFLVRLVCAMMCCRKKYVIVGRMD